MSETRFRVLERVGLLQLYGAAIARETALKVPRALAFVLTLLATVARRRHGDRELPADRLPDPRSAPRDVPDEATPLAGDRTADGP